MIEFHALAEHELREATFWYRERSHRAAVRFAAEVKRAVDRIFDDPTSHPTIGADCRYVRVSRFPYLLVFHIDLNDHVKVLAVAHASRHPHFWQDRK